ncbi:MAG: hypothetical protein V4689_05840 [Verrucomicrobiota bacterium]
MMLACLGIAIFLSLHFLSYNIIYTESEVTRDLLVILIFSLAGLSVLLSFYSRRFAAFLMIGAGGLLLIWQSCGIRKWAMIHEEVVGIIQHVEQVRKSTGSYPVSLNGHMFRNPDLKSRFDQGYTTDNGGFKLSYFMNNPGTSYWYDSNSGFHYYPD